MDDKEIITLFESRNENAIGETAKKYGTYCHTIANGILANEQDAEECVSDTWLRAWNSIPPQKPNSLKLFLAKITRNVSFNRYREQTREKRGGGEIALVLDELDEVIGDSYDMETVFLQKEIRSTLNRFLHEIPERDADVFIRRYFYVESTERIAKRYWMRESNVRLILSRTRQRLKEFLKKESIWI